MLPLFNLIRKDCWPLYIAIAAFLVPSLILGQHLLQSTGGAFSLPHDESFLQLSTAKTLAFNRVWGVGKYAFSSASPSLLYPVVLAVLFFIFGAHLVIIPLVNIVIAVILLACIQQWLNARAISPARQLLVLLAVTVLTPLPLMIVYGMERSLLLLMAFLFISRLSDEWQTAVFSRRTLIYGALLVSTRYDGALLIAGISLVLVWRRRWLEAFELALWSLLPVLVFGIISNFKGNYFVPNIFMVAPAQLQFSYDWLIGCGVAVIVPFLSHYKPKRLNPGKVWGAGLIVAVIVLTLMTRNLYAFQSADSASLNIYKQEYPVGKFLQRYYRRYPIASDDIGLASYLMEGRYIDLSGRASIEVARSRKGNYFSADWIQALSTKENTFLAVVSDGYAGGVPKEWIKTASWVMPGYDPSDKKIFSFFSRDTAVAADITKKIKEYSFFLSKEITVEYFYSPAAPTP
jgi:hypothetical protein